MSYEDARRSLEEVLSLDIEFLDQPEFSLRAFDIASRFNRPSAYDAYYLAVVDLDEVLACGRAALKAYRAEGCSPQRAVFLAALSLCERYGFAMYHGRGKRKISEVFLP